MPRACGLSVRWQVWSVVTWLVTAYFGEPFFVSLFTVLEGISESNIVSVFDRTA